ncbi:hypothetical protein N9D61_03950 [Planktomarina sp.]|jgi:hypothetical protein|nr:hypothetical protein [Planktomarina sp.]
MIGNIKIDGKLKTATIDGVSNIVTQAKWYIDVVRDEYTMHIKGGVANFEYNPSNPFIEYANLTEDTVVGWVTSSMTPEELAFWEKVESMNVTSEDNYSDRRATHFDVMAQYVPAPEEQDTPW